MNESERAQEEDLVHQAERIAALVKRHRESGDVSPGLSREQAEEMQRALADLQPAIDSILQWAQEMARVIAETAQEFMNTLAAALRAAYPTLETAAEEIARMVEAAEEESERMAALPRGGRKEARRLPPKIMQERLQNGEVRARVRRYHPSWGSRKE